MATWTNEARTITIRSMGHARAALVALEHVPSLFGPHNGRVASHCAACGLMAYLRGNVMEGDMVQGKCRASGWTDNER